MSGYRGDIDPDEAWNILRTDPEAVLVDVRSEAEWTFVGVPDLSEIGRDPVLVEWATFPGMAVNPSFPEIMEGRLEELGVPRGAPILFLCRSGARSRNAAIVMTTRGYANCFNVGEGFEGELDGNGQRGTRNGWKKRGLPWRQR